MTNEKNDPKAELRRARAALERRRDDVIEGARAWTRAPGSESRRILGDLREAVEDLEDAETRVRVAEIAAAEPGAPALPANASPDAHGASGSAAIPDDAAQTGLPLGGSSS